MDFTIYHHQGDIYTVRVTWTFFLFFEKQATPSEKTIVILWDTVVGNQIDKNKIKCYCGIELLVRASSVVLNSWMLVRLREEREERLWDTDTWYIQEKRKDTRELFTNTKHLFFFILVFIFFIIFLRSPVENYKTRSRFLTFQNIFLT
jgi:hypothetical protein